VSTRSLNRDKRPDVGHRPLQVWIAGLIVIVDQATKWLVRARLELHESIEVIPGLLSLTRVHNTGAAYGLLNDVDFPFKTLVMALVACAAIAGLAMWGATLEPEQQLARNGLASVLGGAAGNLIDRIAAGYVLDFVDVYRGDWHFWAFNVADAAITVGVALMLLDFIGLGTRRVSRTV
jgi:signal peptidase II